MSVSENNNIRRIFFLSNNPRFYVAPVRRHGRAVYMFTTEPSPLLIDKALKGMKHRLKVMKFNPARDVVALTGNSTLLSLLLFVLACNYQNVRVLVYNPRDKKYSEHSTEEAYDFRESVKEESR